MRRAGTAVADGVWTHAFLVRTRLALPEWDAVSPTRHDLSDGYLVLDAHHILTVAQRDASGGPGTYVRIRPGRWALARHIDRHEDVPDTEHDVPQPTDTPVPRWARAAFRLGMRWLVRLHAHTPVARWRDPCAAAQICTYAPYVQCRATWTVYAAPPGHASDYALHIQGTLASQQQTALCVRVERDRKTIAVEQSEHHPHTRRSTHTQTRLPLTHAPHDADAMSWFVQYALASEARIARVCAAMQQTPEPSAISPSLTPRRQTELYALEQRWYRQRPVSGRPF